MLQNQTSSLRVPAGSRGATAVLQDEADSSDPDQSEEPTTAPGFDAGMGCATSLDLQTPDCEPPALGWLEDQFIRIAGLAGVLSGRIAIAVVDDDRMTQMHKQYCDQPGTTDVLTFDMRDQPGQPVQGDMVLCMDEAIRQAGQRGHDTRLELLLYAVHGLMHLLGEDDHDEAGYQKMHRREDELLTRAGLGPVFGL